MGVFALRLGNGRYLPLLELDRPVRVTRLFTTLADGQRKAIFHFYFREHAGGEWRPVGRIEWNELPPSRAGEPTLELRLIPGRSGSLLLRLRERSTGAARNYRLRLPVARPEVEPEAPREAPPEPARSRRPAEKLPRTHGPSERRVRRRRLAIGLSLAAAVLLAIGAVLVIRPIPSKETYAPEQPAQAGPLVEVPREPAPVVSPAPPVEPPAAAASADGVSGASTREPAAQPLTAPGKPASQAAKPAAAAPGPKPDGRAEPLSYRVQWGDTLWEISEHYYGNPYLYSLLAGENAIVDPDLIIPGTELRLPPRIDDRDRKR